MLAMVARSGSASAGDARPVVLDELADDALLAQHLRRGQHHVGRGRALAQLAGELEADHLRDQHRHRLAEHRRLGLDAAHAPAEHAEPVDHGRVRVGADERVGIDQAAVAAEDDLRQVLEVHLVADAHARRHDAEATERLLPPAQQRVALLVALVLEHDVEPVALLRGERVDLHRVIDDEIHRHQRIDPLRVAAQARDGVAHRRQIDDARHAGEVLQEHARRTEGDLAVGLALGIPLEQRLDVVALDGAIVLVAQEVLEQHLERERQALPAFERGEAVQLVRSVADLERAFGPERVRHVRSFNVLEPPRPLRSRCSAPCPTAARAQPARRWRAGSRCRFQPCGIDTVPGIERAVEARPTSMRPAAEVTATRAPSATPRRSASLGWIASRQPSSPLRSFGRSFIHELCERRWRRPIEPQRRRRPSLRDGSARPSARHVGQHLARPDVDAAVARRHRLQERARLVGRHQHRLARRRQADDARHPRKDAPRRHAREQARQAARGEHAQPGRARQIDEDLGLAAPLAARRGRPPATAARTARAACPTAPAESPRARASRSPAGSSARARRSRCGRDRSTRSSSSERSASPSRAPAGADKSGLPAMHRSARICPSPGVRISSARMPVGSDSATGAKAPMRLGRGGRSSREQARQLGEAHRARGHQRAARAIDVAGDGVERLHAEERQRARRAHVHARRAVGVRRRRAGERARRARRSSPARSRSRPRRRRAQTRAPRRAARRRAPARGTPARSSSSSSKITRSMPMTRNASVSGRMNCCSPTACAVSVRRGLTKTTRPPRASIALSRSSARGMATKLICDTSGLEPRHRKKSVWSRSGIGWIT